MADTVAWKKAFGNVLSAVKPGINFPKYVFWESWDNFLFFHQDALFFGNFNAATKELLTEEGASAACVVNLSRRSKSALDQRSSLCLEKETTASEYEQHLRSRNEAHGWLYRMDTYACASEIGLWCVYHEKGELAVLALRGPYFMKQVRKALDVLRAYPLPEFWERQHSPAISWIDPEWRSELGLRYTPSFSV